jgi:thioesterase domain-containing protein
MTDISIDKIQPAVQLGFDLKRDDSSQVHLNVPMDGNLNDKQTMFAGSQFSGMVLAGWKLAMNWVYEQQIEAPVVIKNTQMDFLRPVTSTLHCHARFLSEPEIPERGNVRLAIEVVAVNEQDKPCARLTGDYRAILGK